MIEVLDPTAERDAVERPLATRGALPGRIALVDIRKPRGDVLLDELERLLRERGADVCAPPSRPSPSPRPPTCAARSPATARRSSRRSPTEAPACRAVCATCWSSRRSAGRRCSSLGRVRRGRRGAGRAARPARAAPRVRRHPVQDRSDDELREQARSIAAEVIDALTG
jgi:alkanesulfonate monooxygenase SsuD/methylene tetrahydromethanopterin reductase-like flavin-dependent oxidoreductase (luciferase family)